MAFNTMPTAGSLYNLSLGASVNSTTQISFTLTAGGGSTLISDPGIGGPLGYTNSGLLLAFDTEVVRVVNVQDDVITVVRGDHGTTPATHVNAAAGFIINSFTAIFQLIRKICTTSAPGS